MEKEYFVNAEIVFKLFQFAFLIDYNYQDFFNNFLKVYL